MPKVSVIMPVHRMTPFFGAAVRSILAQTWRDLELLLVENGAGLGAASLGDLDRDPRIRVLALPDHEGIAPAINWGVTQAAGDYLALMDYDDVALPQRIERQATLLASRPGPVLVSCQADTIDAAERVTGREFSLERPRDQQVFSGFSTPLAPAAYAGRRPVFAQFPFRPRFRWCSDFDFFSRVAEALPTAGVPEVLLHYRRYPAQTTMARRQAMNFEECAIRLLTARRRSGRPEDFDRLIAEWAPWFDEPPTLPVLYATFARRFLDEGLPVMAAYHARKLLSVSLAPSHLATALRLVAAAGRAAAPRTREVLRLFLVGPVIAYGLAARQ